MALLIYFFVCSLVLGCFFYFRKANGRFFILPVVVVGLLIFRFGLHYYLLTETGLVSNELDIMGLSSDVYLDRGLDIVSFFTAAFALGYVFLSKFRVGRGQISDCMQSSRGCRVLVFCFIAGLSSVLLFFVMNGGGLDYAASGEFRGVEIRSGSGFLFYLGFLSVASGVLLVDGLLERQRLILAFLLALAFFMVFGVLGGRVRAMILFVAFLLMLYLRGGGLRLALIAPILMGLVVVFVAMSVYRSGAGLEGAAGLYSDGGIFTAIYLSYISEMGQLHSLAAISEFPGELLYTGSWTNIFWPLNSFLKTGAQSGGVFVVESLLDSFDSGRKWGFHATAMGDAYLAFGIPGVVFIGSLLGGLLGSVTIAYLRGRVELAFLVLLYIEMSRVVFESMDKLPEIYTTMAFYFIVRKLCRIKLRY